MTTTVFDSTRMGERLGGEGVGIIVDVGDPRGIRARRLAEARQDGAVIAEKVNATFSAALQPGSGSGGSG